MANNELSPRQPDSGREGADNHAGQARAALVGEYLGSAALAPGAALARSETPVQRSTLEDLTAAGKSLSYLQMSYATVGFMQLPSEQGGRLKDAFLGLDRTQLSEVGRSLAQLDSPSLKQTIQLMGGTNQDQINHIMRWMQNPEQLGKLTASLKALSPAEFASMNSEQFYKSLQTKLDPPQQAQAKDPAKRPPEEPPSLFVPRLQFPLSAPAESRVNVEPPMPKAVPAVQREVAVPAAARPAPVPGKSADMMSKMMGNLTDEQKRKITPEVIEKALKTMDQLRLKPEDIEALTNKFSSLMPKDKNGKGFDMALRAMDKLSADQLRPVLDFARNTGTGDIRLLKSVAGGSLPSDPEKLIDKAAKMSPRQIQHGLDQVNQGLALYHQIPPAFRGIAKSLFIQYAPRPRF